jgi:hypothetical protein
MEDADSDSADAEMADYGTDFKFSDTMSTQTLMGTKALWHSRLLGIGNRIPRFPVLWGDFPIPDSRLAWNRESGNGPGRFPSAGNFKLNRESGSRGGTPGISSSWSEPGLVKSQSCSSLRVPSPLRGRLGGRDPAVIVTQAASLSGHPSHWHPRWPVLWPLALIE